jgi:hypothetical protein
MLCSLFDEKSEYLPHKVRAAYPTVCCMPDGIFIPSVTFKAGRIETMILCLRRIFKQWGRGYKPRPAQKNAQYACGRIWQPQSR